MAARQEILDFYLAPAPLADAGAHAAQCADLPGDVGALDEAVQGLLLHQHWANAYGKPLSEARTAESHLRGLRSMLDRLLAHDAAPLAVARSAERRLVGNCRHFTLLFVALLRAKGIPARARCGFANYFTPGLHEDHWVGEYWHAAEGRWVLADAQLDALQRDAVKPDFDTLDVPRDRFLVGGDAWAVCRAGAADPATFGIPPEHERGLWFIAGDLIRDVAALNKVELLPWDVWGAMPLPGDDMGDDLLAFLDQIAVLTHDPDANFAELRARYASDDRLRAPASVFNALRERDEVVE